MYLDENNLYSSAMSQYLHYSGLNGWTGMKWFWIWKEFDVNSVSENSSNGQY